MTLTLFKGKVYFAEKGNKAKENEHEQLKVLEMVQRVKEVHFDVFCTNSDPLYSVGAQLYDI